MYEQAFQLKERPFPAAPSAKHWCETASSRLALEQLTAAVQRGPGISLLVGAPGTGKTLLFDLLARQAAARNPDCVQITCSRLDGRRDLLQRILFELNLPCRDQNESDLRLLAVQHLRGICGQLDRSVLLLVDEAHNLTVELLDELRVLSETAARNSGRCHLALAGTARLEERLAHGELEAFNQRIVCRAFLEPLSRDETAAYIQQHLRRAGGGNRKLFQADAVGRIRELTGGIPRLINQLCDQCLTACAAIGEKSVSSSQVEISWCDLQNLPRSAIQSSRSGPQAAQRPASSIEFGTLEDDLLGNEAIVQSDDPVVAAPLENETELIARPELAGTPLDGQFVAEQAVRNGPEAGSRRKPRASRKPMSAPARVVHEAPPAALPLDNPVQSFPVDPDAPGLEKADRAIGTFPSFEAISLTGDPSLAQESPIEEPSLRLSSARLIAGNSPGDHLQAGDDRELLVPEEATRYEPTAAQAPVEDLVTEPSPRQAQRGPHRPRAIRLDYHQLFAQLRENTN